MKYSKTTLMELSHKYSSILRKCALFNAAILMGAMVALPADAARINWDEKSSLDLGSDDYWESNFESKEVSGIITGNGEIRALPSTTETPDVLRHGDTLLTIKSDVSGFNGTFYTVQYGNYINGDSKNKPNAVSSILFDTDVSHGVKLEGNGNFIFGGNDETGTVKILSAKKGASEGAIFLNNKTLSTESTDISASIYLGGKNIDDNGRNVSVKDYNLSDATLVVSGTGNTTNGSLSASISNSSFNEVIGLANNTQMTGDVVLDLNNVSLSGKVIGQKGGTSDLHPTDTTLTGNIDIRGKNVSAQSIYGQQFGAFGTKSAGINGNVNISLEDSSVGDIRGVNFNAGNYQEWNENYYNGPEKINITIKDTVVKNELLATGSYSSAGDVSITVKGDSVIGYTDKDANEKTSGEDGWIIAGAQKPGAHISNTEINLDTSGTIKIAGEVNVGSREKTGENSEEDGVKGNAVLNILGGGTVNVVGDLRAYHVAGTTALNINNVTANVGGVAADFDTITLGEGAKLNLTGTLAMKAGSALNVANLLNGTIISGGTIAANGATLDSTSFVVSKADTYTFADSKFTSDFKLSDNLKTAIDNNLLYDISYKEGKFTVAEKKASAIAEDVISGGATAQEANTIAAVAEANSSHPVVDAIKEVLQTGNVSAVAQAAKELAPTTSQQVMGVAQGVNNLLSNVTGTRMAALGKAGGDAFIGGSTWVQGLYNHSKQDASGNNAGFSANTKGIAFGIDGKVNEAVTIGLGYGYTKTDADSRGRDVDVDGHNFFIYGQYQPDAWYVNTMLSYGLNKYEEKKSPMGVAMKAKYDVNTFAANVMTGYDFDNGITPEGGFRYVLADQESYNDGAQRVSTDKNDVLTAVMGVKYSTNVKAEDWTFKPTLRLAATYDVVSDNSKANVNVTGGSNYQITGDRLHRFGVETGVGVTSSVKDWDLTLEYNGGFRKDFQSHTGMLKATYHF